MSGKTDTVTGVLSVAVFGVSGEFSAADITNWGSAILGAAPVILILFLIWRMYKLDKQHAECTTNQAKTQEQLVLAYRAIQSVQVRRRLPTEEDFCNGNFNLDDHAKKEI